MTQHDKFSPSQEHSFHEETSKLCESYDEAVTSPGRSSLEGLVFLVLQISGDFFRPYSKGLSGIMFIFCWTS